MKTAIVACGTLFRELTEVMDSLSCHDPVFWLKAGAHNHPQQRREEILQALEQCRGFEIVLLAMAYCGGALEGISSPASTLVLPRCDDCIPLLLGSQKRRAALKDFYFLTQGWLDGKDNIQNEYRRTLERYGQARADRIYERMLLNYRYLGYIPTVSEDLRSSYPEIWQIAAQLKLEPVILEGSKEYLADLIQGNHDSSRFLVVPPGVPITRDGSGSKRGAAYDTNQDSSP